MFKNLAVAACAALFASTLAPSGAAFAQGTGAGPAAGPAAGSGAGVRLGYLSCNVARGVGFVFGMTRQLNCTYAPSSGQPEQYTGQVQQFGINIGFLERGVIVWVVVAPSANIAPGSLAGSYGGVAAGAAVGLGLGANALFGGSNTQFALQPVSIEGTQGLNIAAGIAGLTLRAVRPARPAGQRQ